MDSNMDGHRLQRNTSHSQSDRPDRRRVSSF